MIEPARFFLAVVVANGVFGLAIGALISAGGLAAVRRHWRQLALIGLAVSAVALIVPVLDQQWGDAFGLLLLGFSVLLFVIRQAQRRGEPPELAEQRRAAIRSPRGRWLIAAVVVFCVVVTLLAATLGGLSN